MKKYLLFTFIGLSLLSGCIYKMPTCDNVSTLPHTNNPSNTRERPHSLPGQV